MLFHWIKLFFGAADDQLSIGKTAGCTGMARWTMLIYLHQYGVIIAVQGHRDDVLRMSGRVALAPVLLAGP